MAPNPGDRSTHTAADIAAAPPPSRLWAQPSETTELGVPVCSCLARSRCLLFCQTMHTMSFPAVGKLGRWSFSA